MYSCHRLTPAGQHRAVHLLQPECLLSDRQRAVLRPVRLSVVSHLKKRRSELRETKLRVSIPPLLFLNNSSSEGIHVHKGAASSHNPLAVGVSPLLQYSECLPDIWQRENDMWACELPRPQIRPADKAELDSMSSEIKACWATASVTWHWVLPRTHAASVRRTSMVLWTMRTLVVLVFPNLLDSLIWNQLSDGKIISFRSRESHKWVR